MAVHKTRATKATTTTMSKCKTGTTETMITTIARNKGRMNMGSGKESSHEDGEDIR